MLNAFLALSVFSILLLLFVASVVAGRQFGRRQLAKGGVHKLEVVSVAEGAVFTLLGLLVAFTFSGAYDRFELRKTHIIEEANAFETAYQRLDLLKSKKREALKEDLRLYLDLHLAAYHAIPDLKQVYQDLKKERELEKKIWKEVVAASLENSDQGLNQLVPPAINAMFEAANTGIDMLKLHSPPIIFPLLIGLAILGSFLAGYSTAENKGHRSIHIRSYVILTAFTIYLIMDLEFPRLGLVRVDSFDQILIDVRNEMLVP